MMQGPVTSFSIDEISHNQAADRRAGNPAITEKSGENSRFAETLKQEGSSRDAAESSVGAKIGKSSEEGGSTEVSETPEAMEEMHAATETGKELPPVVTNPAAQLPLGNASLATPASAEGLAAAQSPVKSGDPFALSRTDGVGGQFRGGESSVRVKDVSTVVTPRPVERVAVAISENPESLRSMLTQRESAGLGFIEQVPMSKSAPNGLSLGTSALNANVGVVGGASTVIEAASSSFSSVKSALTTIEIPLGDSRWSGAVAQRAVVAIQQGLQQAQITITPAQLGPIDLQLQLQDEKASVTMISPHAAVREMLESATPRLREMLEQQGFSLEQSLVSDQSPWGSSGEDSGQSGATDESPEEPLLADEGAASIRSTGYQSGLVDRYA
jgi:flagellar hook-length control protein FliK